jgi:chromosome segregation ATPase
MAVASALLLEKNRPVSKVISLLKDMQKQLEGEAEEDQEVYDKMACWCTTNDKEKTKSIAEAEQHIAELTSSIEEGAAKSAQLSTEIKNLEKEVSANQIALDKATALRTKQLAEFNEEEKDLLQSIQALGNAVVVLKKHNSAFLQSDSTVIPNIKTMLKHQFYKFSDILDATISPSEKRIVNQFLQSQSASGKVPAYAPQSGEIFGILSNMKETFEANLSTTQKEEIENQKAYEGLKAAKQEEISAGQEQIDKKTDELAATDEKLANNKQDLEDTRNSLSADEKFLADLKEKCKQTDQEYEQRQKTRRDEISAVSEALNFLNSDDAHDLFTSTFNGVQLVQRQSSVSREKASALLRNAALKLNKPQLSALATSVKLDAFTKVKKAIDDLIADLLKEKEDEIKHKDFCINGLHENEKDTTDRSRNKSDLEAKIGDLDGRIKDLQAQIDTLKAEIAEAQVQLKRAGEDREKQNLEFQKTVQDQRATVALLNKAMEVLKGFYEKAKGNAFLQSTQEPVGPPPPAGFKSYENNASGGGVIAMITQIVNDAKAMEAEAIHDEEDAQSAYESFVQESNQTVTAKEEAIVNKSQTKATAEVDRSQAKQDLESTTTELEQLANEALDLHKACDFVLKNFDIRQEARDQEVEALRQAKAILSGADLK